MGSKIGQEILQLFRRFQALNNFVALDPTWNLSLAESHALTELDAHGPLSTAELSRVLAIPRVPTVTIVNRLRRSNLFEQAAPRGDAREKAIQLSAKGKAFLAEIDPPADAQLDKILAPLAPSERVTLRRFFGTVADGHAVPKVPTRQTEHMIRGELRRATRALRLIHSDFSGDNMGSPEWQVLAALRERPDTSPTRLAQQFGVPLSTMTGLCARLKGRGLIGSKGGEQDRRVSLFSLTRVGAKQLESSERAIASKISTALQATSKEELDLGLRIFRKAVATVGNAEVLRRGLETVCVTDEGMRAEARALAIELLVRRGWQQYCPESLCAKGDFIYTLAEQPGGALRGVCSFAAKRPPTLLLAVVDYEAEESGFFADFITSSARSVTAALKVSRVFIPPALTEVVPLEVIQSVKLLVRKRS